jgi:hypothetical protein
MPRQYHVSTTEPMVLDRYDVFHEIVVARTAAKKRRETKTMANNERRAYETTRLLSDSG